MNAMFLISDTMLCCQGGAIEINHIKNLFKLDEELFNNERKIAFLQKDFYLQKISKGNEELTDE